LEYRTVKLYTESSRNKSPNFNSRPPLARVNTKRRCPECNHASGCMIADDRVLCLRKPSDKQVRGGLGGWWHYRFNAPPPKLAPPVSSPKPIERASADHIAGVLTTLLRKHLTLSEQHRAALRARGLSEGEIERNGYASAPTPDDGDRIARELSDFNLEGVPGFHKYGGEWRMRDFGSGIFVPVRDEHLRIVGCQIRRDDVADGQPKYIWFSSAGKPHGTTSSSPVHFAKPHLLRHASEVLITEGALKADVAAFLLDAPVIAAAGVSNFGQDFAENLKAKFPKLKTCFVAFDSDWRIKPQVKAALEKLMHGLSGAGFRVKVRTWPPHMGKGIDDYLLALSHSGVKEVAA
jgi:hypothetical protein